MKPDFTLQEMQPEFEEFPYLLFDLTLQIAEITEVLRKFSVSCRYSLKKAA